MSTPSTFDSWVTHRDRGNGPGGTAKREPCECSGFRMRVQASVRNVRFVLYVGYVPGARRMQAIFACRQFLMRYIVSSIHTTCIWPGNLDGLKAALKQTMVMSKQWPDEVLTVSIHEKGSPRVPFRKFKDQCEIWRSEPLEDDD